jgi:hypothetical protein
VNGFILSAILESLATRARYKGKMVQVGSLMVANHDPQKHRILDKIASKRIFLSEWQDANDFNVLGCCSF